MLQLIVDMQVDRTGELVVGVARRLRARLNFAVSEVLATTHAVCNWFWSTFASRVGELLDTIECYCRSISAMWDNHNL